MTQATARAVAQQSQPNFHRQNKARTDANVPDWCHAGVDQQPDHDEVPLHGHQQLSMAEVEKCLAVDNDEARRYYKLAILYESMALLA
jgi:hypothetical protein